MKEGTISSHSSSSAGQSYPKPSAPVRPPKAACDSPKRRARKEHALSIATLQGKREKAASSITGFNAKPTNETKDRAILGFFNAMTGSPDAEGISLSVEVR